MTSTNFKVTHKKAITDGKIEYNHICFEKEDSYRNQWMNIPIEQLEEVITLLQSKLDEIKKDENGQS